MTKQYNVETGMQVGNLPSGILGFLDDWYGAEFLPPRPAAIKLAARAPLQIVF